MPDTPTSGKIHIADLVTCPKCGQSNAVGERYCTACGTHLTGITPTQVVHPDLARKTSFFARLLARK
jgi:hypothetical protein